MGLLAALVALMVSVAPAAVPADDGGTTDKTVFPFAGALLIPVEVPLVVEKDGPVGLFLRLNSGAAYNTAISGVGDCEGDVWPGGYITGAGLSFEPDHLWDCGTLEAGEYTLTLHVLAGAGVMTAYLSGAHWAETSSP